MGKRVSGTIPKAGGPKRRIKRKRHGPKQPKVKLPQWTTKPTEDAIDRAVRAVVRGGSKQDSSSN